MALPDVHRLEALDRRLASALHATLAAAGNDAELRRRLARLGDRIDDVLRAPMKAWHLRRVPGPSAIAWRLFVLHDEVDKHEAQAVLGELAPLCEAGLVVEEGSVVSSPWSVSFVGPHVLFADRLEHGGDAVMGAGASTLLLAALAVPAAGSSVRTALDLGCGAGALALSLAAHANEVVATDVSPRAVRLTQLNARFNGVRNVVALESDLFSELADRTFDRIVSQPPFLPVPPGAGPVTFLHGGARGDELALRALASTAPHLAAGGTALFLADLPVAPDDAIATRIATAVGASTPADVIVLQAPDKSLDEVSVHYAAGAHDGLGPLFRRDAIALRDHFEATGVRATATCVIVVQRVPGARTPVGLHVRTRHVHDAPPTPAAIARWVAVAALVADPVALAVAPLGIAPGTEIVEQPLGPGLPPGLIVRPPPAVLAGTSGLSAEDAHVFLEIVRRGSLRACLDAGAGDGSWSSKAVALLRMGALAPLDAS